MAEESVQTEAAQDDAAVQDLAAYLAILLDPASENNTGQADITQVLVDLGVPQAQSQNLATQVLTAAEGVGDNQDSQALQSTMIDVLSNFTNAQTLDLPANPLEILPPLTNFNENNQDDDQGEEEPQGDDQNQRTSRSVDGTEGEDVQGEDNSLIGAEGTRSGDAAKMGALSASDQQMADLFGDTALNADEDQDGGEVIDGLNLDFGEELGIPTFGVEAGTIAEGGDLVFTIYREGETQVGAVVEYELVDDSADNGSDYDALNGDVFFAPGVLSQEVIISTLDDTLYEGDERFSISLVGTSEGKINIETEEGLILDDVKDETTFSVADASVAEGSNLVFTITRDGDAQADQTVSYGFIDDSADGSAVDHSAASGTVTFATGEASQLVTVATSSDTLYEGDEQFSISLSNGSTGSHISVATATGVITDDSNDETTFSVTDASVAEGSDLVFTITRDGDAQADQTVAYSFTDGTAAGSAVDHSAVAGTVTFATGEASQLVTVATSSDTLYE
ncbi:Calx-beta domain-containing protein, partial [Magnetococcus sp. PR-3]|uniref:Calx-beta domain-containing protein n=1 Tax=Magnetococcus sp. PR-3 TaxID=3120355 RepID=UPI002FCE3874